jgi:hypothetical protein
MKKVSLVGAISLLVLLPIILLSNPATKPSNPFDETESEWADSLNVRCSGCLPTGETRTIACDTLRGLAFLCSGEMIFAIDITDPQNPVKIAELLRSRTPDYLSFLFYDHNGENLYIGTTDNIQIWDVSDPVNGQQIGTIDIEAGGVCVANDYAYVTTSISFFIVDISDPAQPNTVGCCKTSGSYAYVTGAAEMGFRVVDISDPAHPHEIAENCDVYEARGIFVNGMFAYIGDMYGKLTILDISDPLDPQTVGYHRVFRIYHYWNTGTPAIYAVGNRAYVAQGQYGLYVYEFYGAGIEEETGAMTQPASLRLLQNPVRGDHIELILHGGNQAVDLELYNLLGQRVKTYSLSPSMNARQMLDIQGFPAGTYFLRMRQGDGNAVKVTILR